MNADNKIPLKGVNEYAEGGRVYLINDFVNVKEGRCISNYASDNEKKKGQNRLCVVAYNEGGYNSTWVDAIQLYKALKNYFEKK